MRRLVALLILCSCNEVPTTLRLQLYSSGGLGRDPPTSISVSVWDKHGPLALERVVSGHVPGTILIVLPDVSQKVRVALADADDGLTVASLIQEVVAHEDTGVEVYLDGGGDKDGDHVPDKVDNCPSIANREQRDQDGDGVGDACMGEDLSVPDVDLSGPPLVDLRGADLSRPPCNALYCDNFEDDLISPMYLTSPSGSLRWALTALTDAHQATEIDFTGGALGSLRSLRLRVTGDVVAGMIADFQRYEPGIGLYPSVPNYSSIINGPTYERFFVRFSDPPSIMHGSTTTLGYVFWGTNPTDNLELLATADSLTFNKRFAFGSFTDQYGATGVDWLGGWVCVEWKHESVTLDGGMGYRGTASINGTQVALFEGTGTPAQFGGFILAADVELRPDNPTFTKYTQWFDEVKFSDQPIGCAN